jgi:hypothetical protein
MLQQTRTAVVIAIGSLAAFSCGGPSTFTLTGASVDASYQCPVGANNSTYVLHATIDVTNGTSNTVTIKSVGVVMTLVAVKGTWLEQVGDKYTASNVTFVPSSFGSGASGTVRVTIPSACSNGKTSTPRSSYGDYAVALTVETSAGTYTIQSANRHRIQPA